MITDILDYYLFLNYIECVEIQEAKFWTHSSFIHGSLKQRVTFVLYFLCTPTLHMVEYA